MKSAALVLVALSSSLIACDCWSTIHATVQVADSIPVVTGKTIRVVAVAKIYHDDVTGTNSQGIPEGKGTRSAVITLTTDAGART